MILGIDLGNVNVKTSTGIIYPNKIAQNSRTFDESQENQIEYEGETYIMGAGEYQTNYVKADKKQLVVSLLAAIVQSTDESINHVVLGLPTQQYKQDKRRFKEKLLEKRMHAIILNGECRKLVIPDIEIFPECLAVYYSLSEEQKMSIGSRDIVIIDGGGRTTNICLYSLINGKRKLENYITIPAGTLNIYSDFITAVNDKYNLDKLKEESAEIIKNGLWLDGEKIHLGFTKGIFEKYFERIMSELRLNYPIRTAQVILCGGGGLLLQGMFKREIKGLLVINDIFANANGFAKVGESLWR